jgi:hypothetical protein
MMIDELAQKVLQATADRAPFVRSESSLMLAFEKLPKVEASPLAAARKPRIFEMRIYESANSDAARRKVEMFNGGGEIAIFQKTGLTPVFFGQTLIGPRLPNLTYMVVFEDNASVITTEEGETKGSDIKGAVAREAAERWPRIAATASTII